MTNVVIDDQFEVSNDILGFGAATILNGPLKATRIVESCSSKPVDFGTVQHDICSLGKFESRFRDRRHSS
jgi:hypothetical protein